MKKMIGLFVSALALAGCATSHGAPGNGRASHTEDCKIPSEQEVRGLFERWNRSLDSHDPSKVVDNYADRSVLLATVANEPLLTRRDKEGYFVEFLKNDPTAVIKYSFIERGCNSAVDAGVYKFTYRASTRKVCARYTFTYHWTGREWLITSHHSSAMPNTPDPAVCMD
jgi:uncharacterized protein (TIGR02246 family)